MDVDFFPRRNRVGYVVSPPMRRMRADSMFGVVRSNRGVTSDDFPLGQYPNGERFDED